MSSDYDPQQDPIYLQKREIEILEAIHERLKDIRDFQDNQNDTLVSIKNALSSLNTNAFWIGIILIVGIISFFIWG